MFLPQKQKEVIPVADEQKSFVSIPRRESFTARTATPYPCVGARHVAFAAAMRLFPSLACFRPRRPHGRSQVTMPMSRVV
jgi:hypothetical protein